MTTVVMERGYLPWNSNTGEEQLFKRTLLIVMAVALFLGLLVPLFEVPQPEREVIERVPARLARFLLQRSAAPPVIPKVNRELTREKEERPKEPAQSEQQKPQSDSTVNKRARERASQAGVLALSSELSALHSSGVAGKAKRSLVLSRGGTQETRLGGKMIAAASSGSGGIDTSGYRRDSGSGGELGEHKVVSAEAVNPSLVAVAEEEFKRRRQPKRRDQETVIRVLDANKGRIYAIYNRALRSNPLLAGRVVLELIIEPSGRVSACRVLSSELDDKGLENKLIARIKMLEFGAEKVPIFKFEYPIEFMPS